MTRDNATFDKEAFNAWMVRMVMVIFAAVAIVLALGLLTDPSVTRNDVAQQSNAAHGMTVSDAGRP